MNQVIHRKELKARVHKKLDKERITIGGRNQQSYKRQYHLKITQYIINKVIDTFLDVILETISEGDTVMIDGFVKIAPVLKEEKDMFNPYDGKRYVHPKYFQATAYVGQMIKNACKDLSKRTFGEQTAADENLKVTLLP